MPPIARHVHVQDDQSAGNPARFRALDAVTAVFTSKALGLELKPIICVRSIHHR